MAKGLLILLNIKIDFNSLSLVGFNTGKSSCLSPANWILLFVSSILEPMWFYYDHTQGDQQGYFVTSQILEMTVTPLSAFYTLPRLLPSTSTSLCHYLCLSLLSSTAVSDDLTLCTSKGVSICLVWQRPTCPHQKWKNTEFFTFLTENTTSSLVFYGQMSSALSKPSLIPLWFLLSILKIINYYELQWGNTLDDSAFWI